MAGLAIIGCTISIAMGNTGIAEQPTAYSIFYNPAIIGTLKGKKAGLSHSFLSLDRRVNFISFAITTTFPYR